ncbi:MAG: aminomethyl-transferring glycine dehydrogenase, partial [Actinobacteria bacterium]|nr:aminomethyl-transferring glycine dehydrogenase [Actinomycetota bacterium]
ALCHRVNGKAGETFFVDVDAHPQTIAVVETRAEPLGVRVVVGDPDTDIPADGVFGVLLQYPGSSGAVADPSTLVETLHARGVLVAAATDLLACTLLTPPGEWGADVVVGSAQRFGVPLGFGGPHAGFMGTRQAYARNLPGRLVGVSVDAGGRPALRLALQTREQHIRREKATSNICTAQVLLSVISALYAMYHGPDGLRHIATRVARLTEVLAEGLRRGGVDVVTPHHFDTITVRVPGRADHVLAEALDRGVNLRRVDGDTLAVALDETSTARTVAAVWGGFGLPGDVGAVDTLDRDAAHGIPAALRRTSGYLTHPVFSRYRSETEMLRYLRRMADRDLALDRTMIPLGSCTMKLNATAEMAPVTWPEFGTLHPFAPIDQAVGYRRLFADLEAWLAEVTGYDAVSLQPNAGSQGEFAGLLAIRAYHRAHGDLDRDVCLIPASAHGTNAASAAMCGMKVVVVKCDDDGNVDLGDLRARAEEHADRLSALMVTYPSTHGVYEEHIREVCDVVHAHGGQVYLDGANLNALVGLARPGWLGADVSHLNLHKTFCIPHGGGGPGVGPIGVKAHLAPYLPNHPLQGDAGPATGVGPISGAPWGSAGILPIPWAYVRMMGGEGLRRATEVAVCNANYVAARLRDHF